jgi:hypothetical protein
MRFIFSSKVALFGVIGYFSIACSGKIEKSDSKAHESYASTDSAMIEQPNAYERAQGQLQRKFVRTADLQFKVKDVRKSSEQIEDLTTRYGGFVTYSHLQSNIIAQKTVVISQDSLLEVSSVNIENAITIRVPNRYLLDILKELNSMMLYVDHRTIKADDVSMQMLSNDLANKRQEKFVKRNQTVHQNRKGSIAAAVEAEETLLSHQSNADENKIQNMSLQDQVDYSTITINIYQTTFLDKVMVENRERIDNYRTNVFVRIWDSLKTGWMFFEDLLVILMRLWVFWLIGVVVFSYWKYKKRVQSPIKTH